MARSTRWLEAGGTVEFGQADRRKEEMRGACYVGEVRSFEVGAGWLAGGRAWDRGIYITGTGGTGTVGRE
jgi:hypothetical protein